MTHPHNSELGVLSLPVKAGSVQNIMMMIIMIIIYDYDDDDD